jgi:hypothetical protein
MSLVRVIHFLFLEIVTYTTDLFYKYFFLFLYEDIREPTVEELQDCAIRLLREWVVESGVAHMHSTRLLHILKDFAGMTFLPRTTKTLLGSIRGKLNFKEIPPGRYYHSGVEAGLLKVMLAFKEIGIPIPNVVPIIFNVDGSSTSKSGYGEFWQILCRIVSNYFLLRIFFFLYFNFLIGIRVGSRVCSRPLSWTWKTKRREPIPS